MRATRRYWEVAGFALFAASLAVVLSRPVLLVGAAALGAWLLATQYSFTHALSTTTTGVSIEQTVTPAHAATNEPIQVTVTTHFSTSTPLSVTIDPQLPVPLSPDTEPERTAEHTREHHPVTTSFSVNASVAGRYELPAPHLTFRDPLGLFEETIQHGPTADLIIEPRAPRNIHIGRGGEEYAAAFGEHPADQKGAGLDPAEIRRYLPGDPANRIDWNATARLQEPHVREFNAETDRETTLVVDHRASMHTGRDGETKLDYAREVALAVVDAATEWNDPLGYYAIGDNGITTQHQPEATQDRYATIRTSLHDLHSNQPQGAREHTEPGIPDPARARHISTRLTRDDTAFATRLTPYFSATDQYVERIETRPLFHTIRSSVTRRRGHTWTLLFTDDEQRTELAETLKLIRRHDGRALVFITPSVLYEPGSLADIEDAYRRYREFEEWRRDLDRLDHVTALEIAPGDRLDALLAANTRVRAQ